MNIAQTPTYEPKIERSEQSSVDETVQMLVWGAAILFFGFGDTLTSLMVFADGGYESNILMGAILKLVGPTIGAFMAIKIVTTLAVVILGRMWKPVEWLMSMAMLGIGLFLVGNNLAVLML